MPNEVNAHNNEQNDMNEILLTIKEFADNVYKRFDDIDRKFVEVDKRFDVLEKRIDILEGDVGHMRVNMVTKDYLDDKLADFRSESRQFNYQLLYTLESKRVISQKEHELLHKLA